MIESQDKIYHSQFTYIVGELNHLKTEVEFWQDL
jgi:hypothetical protein